MMKMKNASTDLQDEGIRLAKRVAALAGVSRREAELLIENGAVRVDGRVVEVPAQRVRDAQQVDIQPGARPSVVEAKRCAR